MSKRKEKQVEEIFSDYDRAKHKHLEKMASKMLKNDETIQKLKEKKINTKFLDFF